MSERESRDREFDRLVTAWFETDAHISEPEALLASVVKRTKRAHRIPAWLLPERWTPRQLMLLVNEPILRAAVLLVLAAIVALAVGVAIIGGRRGLPPPFGPAAVGRLAYVSGGEIFTVKPDGSDRRRLTATGQVTGRPVWSPDGTRIAFKVYPTPTTPEKADLYVVDAEGHNIVALDHDTVGLRQAHPQSWRQSSGTVSWSPDSHSLLYSKAVDGIDRIFIASADGSAVRQVGNFAQAARDPLWSPDARRIAFVLGLPAIDGLYVMNADGSSVRRLTRGLIDEFDQAEWKPDGTQLVFSGSYSLQKHEIYLVDADSSTAERAVTSNPFDDVDPSWSPDGRRIAYLNSTNSAWANAIVANSDGSGQRTLPGSYGFFTPQWSPDGARVVVTDASAAGSSQPPTVVLLDPSGTSPRIAIQALDYSPSGASQTLGRVDDTSWQRLPP